MPGIVQSGNFHIGGTYSQNDVMNYQRYPVSERHLGKFPDSVDFQCWKVNFKTKVCAISSHPTITMSWIKEAEIAKSIDDLMTSQSIEGRSNFPDFDVLGAKVASALKKVISNVHFRSSAYEEGRLLT